MRPANLLSTTLLLLATPAFSQATPTAIRRADFTAAAGASAVYTGLGGGRNLSLTGALDFNLAPIRRIRPSLEIRGTRAIDKGTVDGQSDLLGGLRLSTPIARLQPYADLLAGVGQLTFPTPYLAAPTLLIISESPSFVLSPGVGLRVPVTQNFAIFADAQFQRWRTPTTASGHILSVPLTLGLVYRIPIRGFRR